MKYAIEINNLVKEYKVFPSPKQRLFYSMTHMNRFKPSIFTAVDNVNFKIPKGEILGIIGKNGAGKSTILKLITGVSFPTHGDIKVHGRISSLLELGAGFNPELTGMENIYFQANLLGISRDEIESRVPDILEFADIGDFINQPVKNYSSGMFARLAFATAINVDPEILIVDEVLAVGDIAFQFKCIEKMKEFAEQGVTIIFVTHSMMSLYRFCERAIWIDKGRIVMDGTVEDVVPRYEDDIKRGTETEKEGSEYVSEFLHMNDAYTATLDNKRTKELGLLESFKVVCNYDLNVTLTDNPYVAISVVKDGVNYDMFGIYPSLPEYTLPKEKGTYEIEIELQNPRFNIGEYDIYVAVMEKSGISQLYFSRVTGIEVVGDHKTLGLVDVEHAVRVKSV